MHKRVQSTPSHRHRAQNLGGNHHKAFPDIPSLLAQPILPPFIPCRRPLKRTLPCPQLRPLPPCKKVVLSPNCPTIQVVVYNRPVAALIDTGAALSCLDVNSKFASSLSNNYQRVNVELTAANNTRVKVLGSLPVVFSIGGTRFEHTFLICRKLVSPLILGSDFFNTTKADISYNIGTVTFRSCKGCTVSKFLPSNPSNNFILDPIMAIDPSEIFSGDRQVFPLKPVVLQPNQITYVPVSFHPHPPKAAATFIGKSSLLSDRNSHVPDSVVDSDTVYYPVLNLNTFPKRLDRNTSLGVVDPTALQPVPSTPINSPINPDLKLFTFNINDKLPTDQQQVLRDLLNQYRDVFAARSEDVRQTTVATASFELLESKVVCRRPYKISAEETKACFNQVNKMLAGNFIEPSVSIYNSPIMLIRKKSGEYRFVCDLRGVNKIIKPISYAMPRTEVYIENLKGSKFFSTFDFKDGYAGLPLHESCRDVTSFEIAGVGKFRYKTLPQGLSCAPSLFQMFLDHLLVDLKYPYGISNYFDDACIGTSCFETHVASLRVFLQRMRDANPVSYTHLTLPTKRIV